MTGYGHGEVSENGRKYIVEIRSENNRFLEISLRLPKTLVSLEQRIKNVVQQYVSRGHVYVGLSIEGAGGEERFLGPDEELARIYCQALRTLQEQLALPGEIDIEILSRMPNIITGQTMVRDVEEDWGIVEPALHQAATDLVEMRQAEGQQLCADLKKRVSLLEDLLEQVEGLVPLGIADAKSRLERRLQGLLDEHQCDPLRLALEAGLIAERADVTEECVRFHSHNRLFLETLAVGGHVGKKLGFLLQEMNREANTLGSKSLNADIAHMAVHIKEEIEKLREQVQNIE
jgi:uncharacterized protein (TIGR00255 family)